MGHAVLHRVVVGLSDHLHESAHFIHAGDLPDQVGGVAKEKFGCEKSIGGIGGEW